MKQIGVQRHVCILSNMRDQTRKGAKCVGGFTGLGIYLGTKQE